MKDGPKDAAPPLKPLAGANFSLLRSLGASTAREKDLLLREMAQVRGLVPLLMKSRNGQRWSDEDKAELTAQLRRLSRLSPYLVVVAMPGGLLALPALAWWLDRRRNRKRDTPPDAT